MPLPQLHGERFDRAKRRRADVMLHSFYVVINNALVEAEKAEKIGEELVSMGDFACQLFARHRQNKPAIFLVF